MSVPTLNAPSVQPEAQPTQAEPIPHVSTAPAEGLTSIGKEIWGIGWEEYHKAAEAFAQQKETEFQTEALRIRNEYKQKFGMEAVGRHQSVTQALADARERILGTISSKYAQSVYNNSTLRIHRYAQEAVDGHFEAQNKAVQFGSYQAKQNANVRDIADFARDSEKQAEFIKKAEEIARKQYSDAAPDALEAQVKIAQGKVAEAIIRKLGDAGDPGLNDAVKKWGGLVHESVLEGAQRASIKKHVANSTHQIFQGVKSVDARGVENPYGAPDETTVLKNLHKMKDDPQFKEIQHQVRQELADAKALQEARSDKLAKRIRMAAQEGGGFDLDRGRVSTADIAELNSLAPEKLTVLQDHARNREQSILRAGEHAVDRANKQAFESIALKITKMSDDDLKSYNEDKLAVDMLRDHPGISDGAQERASVFLKRWQTVKPDAFERQALQMVHKMVMARWGGTPDVARRQEERLGEWARMGISNGSLAKGVEPFLKALKEEIAGTWVEVLRSKQKPEKIPLAPLNKPKVIEWEMGPDGPRPKVGGQ
jgi:hypothetical protein